MLALVTGEIEADHVVVLLQFFGHGLEEEEDPQPVAFRRHIILLLLLKVALFDILYLVVLDWKVYCEDLRVHPRSAVFLQESLYILDDVHALELVDERVNRPLASVSYFQTLLDSLHLSRIVLPVDVDDVGLVVDQAHHKDQNEHLPSTLSEVLGAQDVPLECPVEDKGTHRAKLGRHLQVEIEKLVYEVVAVVHFVVVWPQVLDVVLEEGLFDIRNEKKAAVPFGSFELVVVFQTASRIFLVEEVVQALEETVAIAQFLGVFVAQDSGSLSFSNEHFFGSEVQLDRRLGHLHTEVLLVVAEVERKGFHVFGPIDLQLLREHFEVIREEPVHERFGYLIVVAHGQVGFLHRKVVFASDPIRKGLLNLSANFLLFA